MLKGLLADARLFLILILSSLILFFFDNAGYINFLKSTIHFITTPIQYGLFKTSLSVGKQFEFIFFARSAVNQNRALKEQFAQVLSENTQLKKQLAEAKAMVDQQHSLNSQTFNWVESRPIGFSRYLLIDKGSESGIKVGQPVVYKDSYLGKIIEVGPQKSQVMLSSDPDSHISAFAGDASTRAKGVLNGQFGQEMLFDKVLHEEPLKKDDLIYTEGTEVEVPRGLVLGQVTEVLDRPNEIFKQAKVKNIFDALDLDVVFVIIN